MSKTLERLGLWLALACACLLLYGRYVLGQLPIGADNSLMYAPFYSLRWAGGPPLWDPYSLSGTPLIDNLQAALFYPLRWPFFFIRDWRAYFGLFNFLHYLIAFCGMGLWLRALGVRRGAALGGAIVFAAGGHLAGRIINPTIFYSCCWLPWLLLGGVGAGLRYAWATTLGLAMIFWIGSPHLMFYGVIGYALVFGCCALGPLWRGSARGRIAPLLGQRALHLLLAVALAAPVFFPGVLRAGESIRTESTVAANLADSLEYREIVPMLLGGTGASIYPEYIDKCCFVGAVALLLIGRLALRRASWRDRRFLCGLLLVLVGLIFALGRNIGIQYLMPWIPGFRNLAGISRALILLVAGLGLLTGLALDSLPLRPLRRLAWVALGLGAACLAAFAALAWNMPTSEGEGPFVGSWLRAWLAAPSCVGWPFYPLVDSAVSLLAAGAILLLTDARHRVRLALLCALLFVQVWHFSPRVLPPTAPASYFDPPPQVAYLQQVQARQPQAPFRVAGFDPLRLHDAEFQNHHKIEFLTPNLATLYQLEDIQGFDPLIRLNYLDLFLKTSGRAPFNDPIHNLDINRPDRRLFDLLGVRFLIGHPYDRRLTTIPQMLTPAAVRQPVGAWEAAPVAEPITHWFFVSLLDRSLNVPPGVEVARLFVDASEGVFSFPVRNGIETADLRALNKPRLLNSPEFRPLVNMEWINHQPVPSLNNEVREANYRGLIAFGRPLHVRRLMWQLRQSGLILDIAAQGYRLARPEAASDPWRLAFGREDAVAPVFEYLAAKPRAVLLADSSGVDAPAAPGHVAWLRRHNNALRLRVTAKAPATLLLREIWDKGWVARVNGVPQPIEPAEGLLRAIAVPQGTSRVDLVYRPTLPLLLMLVTAGIFLLYVAWLVWRRPWRSAGEREEGLTGQDAREGLR